MPRILSTLCLVLFCLSSCEESSTDCSLVLCAGDEPIRLELIINGENALANGTYTPDDISVSGDAGEQATILILTGLQGATEALLEISDPEWDPGNCDLTLQLGTDRTVELTAEFGASEGPCCGGFLILENVSSPAIEVLDNAGFFTMILE
jgi:hypothetical protein